MVQPKGLGAHTPATPSPQPGALQNRLPLPHWPAPVLHMVLVGSHMPFLATPTLATSAKQALL